MLGDQWKCQYKARLLLFIDFLALKWRHEQSYSFHPSPQMSERRVNKICAVVKWPDHHCGDDLVDNWFREHWVRFYSFVLLFSLSVMVRTRNLMNQQATSRASQFSDHSSFKLTKRKNLFCVTANRPTRDHFVMVFISKSGFRRQKFFVINSFLWTIYMKLLNID